jgi:glycosyltransferase involved in cell wall biosynthesis
MDQNKVQLQIVLPVHQEGESIASVLKEIHDVISPVVPMQFIVCEDGSTDNTKSILHELETQLPLVLDLVDWRRGYSLAVKDGFKQSTAPFVLALDSDGQCDPKDFASFWEKRDQADVVIGWRVNRADTAFRRIMSGTYRLWHRILFGTKLHDPSCPFILIHQPVLQALNNDLGVLKQGFWWEFVARVNRKGFTVFELPVNHRNRKAGVTQVYKINKLPGIVFAHGVGLFKIWVQTRNNSVKSGENI